MKGRAETEAQKREIIERIYAAWCEAPQQRLGQLLGNAAYEHLRVIEDEALADTVEDMIAEWFGY